MWTQKELEILEKTKREFEEDGLRFEYSKENDCNGWIACQEYTGRWYFCRARECIDRIDRYSPSFYVRAPRGWDDKKTEVIFYPNHVAIVFENKMWGYVLCAESGDSPMVKVQLEDVEKGRKLLVGKVSVENDDGWTKDKYLLFNAKTGDGVSKIATTTMPKLNAQGEYETGRTLAD